MVENGIFYILMIAIFTNISRNCFDKTAMDRNLGLINHVEIWLFSVNGDLGLYGMICNRLARKKPKSLDWVGLVFRFSFLFWLLACFGFGFASSWYYRSYFCKLLG